MIKDLRNWRPHAAWGERKMYCCNLFCFDIFSEDAGLHREWTITVEGRDSTHLTWIEVYTLHTAWVDCNKKNKNWMWTVRMNPLDNDMIYSLLYSECSWHCVSGGSFSSHRWPVGKCLNVWLSAVSEVETSCVLGVISSISGHDLTELVWINQLSLRKLRSGLDKASLLF